MNIRGFRLFALGLVLLLAMCPMTHAQQDPAIDHGQHILDLMLQSKFTDVTAEFDAAMTAALPADQLARGFASLKMQIGEFKSVGIRTVAMVGTVKAVTLTLSFDRATLDMVVAFNPQNKIAGLNFTNVRPPEAGADAAAPSPKTRG